MVDMKHWQDHKDIKDKLTVTYQRTPAVSSIFKKVKKKEGKKKGKKSYCTNLNVNGNLFMQKSNVTHTNQIAISKLKTQQYKRNN